MRKRVLPRTPIIASSNLLPFTWLFDEVILIHFKISYRKLFSENLIVSSSKKILWSTFKAFERSFWSTLKFLKIHVGKWIKVNFPNAQKVDQRVFSDELWILFSLKKLEVDQNYFFGFLGLSCITKLPDLLLQHTKVDQKSQKKLFGSKSPKYGAAVKTHNGQSNN